uniref:DNA-binding protein n=1 Tax=Cereibacter sphaeroides (strain ATCC 17025 / ATH 2.4.3) TaxID=349102 RepID=A4WS88_CERS5
MEPPMLKKNDRPPLDRWRADAVLEPRQGLWGLPAIAKCLGVSIDTARRWANDKASGMPVSKPMGRWFAYRTELLAWRQKR